MAIGRSATEAPIVVAVASLAARIGSFGAADVPGRWRMSVAGLIGAAWLIAVIAQATGNAASLHHHALIEGGPPLLIGVPLFLFGWLVMIAAMMLPASLPAIASGRGTAAPRGPSGREVTGLLLAYALVWSIFGLLAFAGDVVLHTVVDATPWLGQRQWLIEASVLAMAGLYQFAPTKRRSLAACRHPRGREVPARVPRTSFRWGLEHAGDCVGSSWALMLVMFAAGFADLMWMVLLTMVMTYESTGRYGPRLASLVGGLLVCWAVFDVSSVTQLV